MNNLLSLFPANDFSLIGFILAMPLLGAFVNGLFGARLGKILIPEVVGNVEFGTRKRNRLYICGTTSLYAVYLNTAAAGSVKR